MNILLKKTALKLFFFLAVLICAFLIGSQHLYSKTDTTTKQSLPKTIDLKSKRYLDLLSELKDDHNFSESELAHLFQRVEIDEDVLELMDKQWEAKPYYQYRPLFITSKVVAKGKKYLEKHKLLLDRIEKKLKVNKEVIVAIWAVESRFGQHMGNFDLFRTLNTLFDRYPRRSDFFRKELIHFLTLCRDNQLDPLTIKGSYAGAFGQAQFMPSSYNSYAVDFDEDGKKDLINSHADIFASIANYLKRFGWILNAPVYADIGRTLQSEILTNTHKQGRKGRVGWRYLAQVQQKTIPRPPKNKKLSIIGLKQPPKQGGGTRYVAGYPNFHAITEYNHSNKYAMVVSEMTKQFTR